MRTLNEKQKLLNKSRFKKKKNETPVNEKRTSKKKTKNWKYNWWLAYFTIKCSRFMCYLPFMIYFITSHVVMRWYLMYCVLFCILYIFWKVIFISMEWYAYHYHHLFNFLLNQTSKPVYYYCKNYHITKTSKLIFAKHLF